MSAKPQLKLNTARLIEKIAAGQLSVAGGIIPNPFQLPAALRADSGEVFFDLDADADVTVYYAADSLIELGKIQSNKSYNFKLSDTAKNDQLLRGLFSAALKAGVFLQGLPVSVDVEDVPYIDGSMYIKNRNQNQAYQTAGAEVQVMGEAAEWAELLKNTPLNQLDFRGNGTAGKGEMTYSIVDIFIQSWNIASAGEGEHSYSKANFGRYVDTDRYYETFWPPVNYGYFTGEGYAAVSIYDLRPWFFLTDLIYLMFAKIGYQVVSEFLDTKAMRKKICYLLKENWQTQNETLINENRFYANVTTPSSYPGGVWPLPVVVFDNDTVAPAFDTVSPPDQYKNTNGIYTCGTVSTQSFTAYAYVSPSSATPITFLSVVIYLQRDNNYSIIGSTTDYQTDGTNFWATANSQEVNLLAGDQVYVLVITDTGSPFTLTNGYFKNSVVSVPLALGQEIKLADLIDPELMSFDCLEGVTHLANLKFHTDNLKKRVYMEPEREYWWYDDDAELWKRGRGFYEVLHPLDISPYVDQATDHISEPITGFSKTLQFEFADNSADAFAKYAMEQANAKTLYGQTHVFASPFPTGTKVSKNPFFAATASRYDLKLGYDPAAPAYQGVPEKAPYLMHIWNSLDSNNTINGRPDKQATRIAPRIAHLEGVKKDTEAVFQIQYPSGSGNHKEALENGTPLAYQVKGGFNDIIFSSQNDRLFDRYGAKLEPFVYQTTIDGTTRGYNLTDNFYGNWLRTIDNGTLEQYGVVASYILKGAPDFRQTYLIDGVLYILKEVQQAHLGNLDQVAEFTFVPVM